MLDENMQPALMPADNRRDERVVIQSASFDIETFNGSIDNCFGPKPERTSKYAPGKKLDFQEGNGDARISVSTMNGDITICK